MPAKEKRQKTVLFITDYIRLQQEAIYACAALTKVERESLFNQSFFLQIYIKPDLHYKFWLKILNTFWEISNLVSLWWPAQRAYFIYVQMKELNFKN